MEEEEKQYLVQLHEILDNIPRNEDGTLKIKPQKERSLSLKLTGLLFQAPLILLQENPYTYEKRTYLPFQIPTLENAEEHSLFSIGEFHDTLLEFGCGAVIFAPENNPENGPLWTYSHGTIVNYERFNHPYSHDDPQSWKPPEKNNPNFRHEYHFQQVDQRQLSNLTKNHITQFLKAHHPQVKTWGIAHGRKDDSQFLFLATPSTDSDYTTTLLEDITWFTPLHYTWAVLQT